MRKFCVVAAALAVVSSPVAAQPTKLNVEPTRAWKHRATGLGFPPVVAGLQRDAVTAFTKNDTDVAANYSNADGSEQITIYLYRNVSGNVPMWFDRASAIIQLIPEKYPNPRSLTARAFTPRGQAVASGLIESFEVGGRIRSTSVALFPVNGFYAKVRASSGSRTAAEVEQLLVSAVNSFNWKSRQREVPAAAIRECPAPLPKRDLADRAVTTSEDRMMSALIGGAIAQTATLKPDRNPVHYCREPGKTQIAYGIYRPAGATDRYMMALLDAGRAIAVGSSDLLQILAEQKSKPRVSVTLIELDRTATFGDFASLPLPEQVTAMVEGSAPLSVATTWGQGREISINTDE